MLIIENNNGMLPALPFKQITFQLSDTFNTKAIYERLNITILYTEMSSKMCGEHVRSEKYDLALVVQHDGETLFLGENICLIFVRNDLCWQVFFFFLHTLACLQHWV